MAKFEDFQASISFFYLLRKSGKIKELLIGNIAYFSIVISIIIISILDAIEQTSIVSSLDGLLSAIIGGLLGLLGFLITGLSILASLITSKAAEKIDGDNIAEELLYLLFSFYFSGSLTAIGIFLSIVDYLVLKMQLPFHYLLYIGLSIVTTYFVVFSILYAVGLLGTCINVFILNIQWNKDKKQ